MASRGCERRGCPRGSSRPPPDFDQQTFVEAMDTAFTTITQASAAGVQRGPNNLQRFMAYCPTSFKGGGDTMVTDH